MDIYEHQNGAQRYFLFIILIFFVLYFSSVFLGSDHEKRRLLLQHPNFVVVLVHVRNDALKRRRMFFDEIVASLEIIELVGYLLQIGAVARS